MSTIPAVIKFLLANFAVLRAHVIVVLKNVLKILVVIPGEQMEKGFEKVIAFLEGVATKVGASKGE